MKKKLIAPSLLSANFGILKEEIEALEKAGADILHIDVMDGHFVPNISFGTIVVETAKKNSNLPLDVHLMIENPDKYIQEFAKAGADYISIHYEATTHLNRNIELIKSFGLKAGVALNPATPILNLEYILDYVDFVVIMSVNPGYGGQSFIYNTLKKIEDLKNIIEKKNLDVQIEVDGGINDKTIKKVFEAGADLFVAGSAILKQPNYKKIVDRFKTLII